MTDPSDSRADALLSAIVDLVPQWYDAAFGPHQETLTVGGVTRTFQSTRRLTPELSRLRNVARSQLGTWLDTLSDPPRPRELEAIQETLVLKWLEMTTPPVDWVKLFSYVERLRQRSYENAAIVLNLLVGEEVGSQDITDPSIQKVLDPLASSPHVYLRVDRELQFVGCEDVLWTEVDDSDDYKLHPEFLHPVYEHLGDDEVSVHLTARGDLILMDAQGLLAAQRKGAWYVYDSATFKNALVDALGGNAHYRVGANLFEVAFDLSYKRHGALLVYDPGHAVLPHVINKESVLYGDDAQPDAARAMLSDVASEIAMGAIGHAERRKRILLELASLDGAVLFDAERVLAVGAMVNPHPDVGGHPGARTTAAESAYRWGGTAIKVSSDADVSVFFRSQGRSGESDAIMRFA